MSFVVRAASHKDIEAIYRMAKSTGGGFTNLPPNRPALKAKLERAAASFARNTGELGDDLFMFVLEDTESGAIIGTCQIFSRVGANLPFYSYRIGHMTQHSAELNRTFRAEMLSLCTDLDGSSEVGGLFLLPGERSAGVGKLLARSRYLFIRAHRARFSERTIAELRGAMDDVGNSPFWDGIGGRFFGMGFREADDFNALHGNQFIADLMPKHPIYTAMMPESAVAVMGVPHTSGRAAMRMLEDEGFAFENYIDIFDGGPTMLAHTDRITSIREARDVRVEAIGEPDFPQAALVTAGQLADYRATFGHYGSAEGGIMLDPAAADALRVSPGEQVTVAAR